MQSSGLWHDDLVHRVPAERAGHHTIDDHVACAAIEGIGDPARVQTSARRFALLADPGRLSLLLAIYRVEEISVTDLSIATGMSDTAVSQALRVLRLAGIIEPHKRGRVVRYRLTDDTVRGLLGQVGEPVTHEGER